MRLCGDGERPRSSIVLAVFIYLGEQTALCFFGALCAPTKRRAMAAGHHGPNAFNVDGGCRKFSEDIKMTSTCFRVQVDGDANVESSLQTWAAEKFVQSHVARDSEGRVVLVCKHAEAKSAKSFKLMMRNFAQRGGQVGKILDLQLLENEHATASGAADIGFATTDVPPTVDFAHPTPDAIADALVVNN